MERTMNNQPCKRGSLFRGSRELFQERMLLYQGDLYKIIFYLFYV